MSTCWVNHRSHMKYGCGNKKSFKCGKHLVSSHWKYGSCFLRNPVKCAFIQIQLKKLHAVLQKRASSMLPWSNFLNYHFSQTNSVYDKLCLKNFVIDLKFSTQSLISMIRKVINEPVLFVTFFERLSWLLFETVNSFFSIPDSLWQRILPPYSEKNSVIKIT